MRGRRTIALEIPKRASIEAYLRMRGYLPAYIRGMDEIEELIAVGNQLREKEVNPYEDHIPYLARKLREYIAHMEIGIRNSTQEEQFDSFKRIYRNHNQGGRCDL